MRWISYAQFFSGCSVFDGEHFWHTPCAKFSVATFSDDGQNSWFPIPYCSAQFTCRNSAAIPNRHINRVFGLRLRCRVVDRCEAGHHRRFHRS
jgi:hypothetical protein